MEMDSNLCWIDLEMSGLDADKQVILEIATIITDSRLEIVAEGPNISIHYADEVLRGMEEWSRTHHTASGLMDRVRASDYTCRRAEEETLQFVSAFCMKDVTPLCGNSVWQDRRFLIRYMPELEAFFHYRMIDVSTLKELVNRWYPFIPPFEKKKAHLALSDILESIQELAYYRQRAFIP
jgi:oligoribonuclease